jgi:ribosome-associated protein
MSESSEKAAPVVPIGEDELGFAYSRSSGPGGQNVNRVQTRVTLSFDVFDSPSLTESQKRRIATRLATRMNKEGVLRVVSQRFRTREANRRVAVERFHELLREALKRKRPRRKTRVSREAKRRRLEQKRRRGEIKRSRAKPGPDED